MKKLWIVLGSVLSLLFFSFCMQVEANKAPPAKHMTPAKQVQIELDKDLLTITNQSAKPIQLNSAAFRFRYAGKVVNLASINNTLDTNIEATDLSRLANKLGKLYTVKFANANPDELLPNQQLQFKLVTDKQDVPHHFELMYAPVPVAVKITTAYANWTQTIYVCNTTNQNVPLTNAELSFNYSATMPTNVWGSPYMAWKVTQSGSQIVLTGGTSFTPDLPSDPSCMNPMTIQFAAAPDAPSPAAPFVFKAESKTGPDLKTGNLNVNVPAAPVGGLANPQITVRGGATNTTQAVAWGSALRLANIEIGSYTVSSASVSNGQQTFVADPAAVTVNENATTNHTMVYKVVNVNGRGTLVINMPNSPEAGLPQPTVIVRGNNTNAVRTVLWGSSWQLSDLSAGTYTITAMCVTTGQKTYEADQASVTVNGNATTDHTIAYKVVNGSGRGTLVINMPNSPEANLPQPIVVIRGNNTNAERIVPWGSSWQLNDLSPGTYTITAMCVATDQKTYEADPATITVQGDSTTQQSFIYKLSGGSNFDLVKGSVAINLENAPSNAVAVTFNGAKSVQNRNVSNNTSIDLPADTYVVSSIVTGYSTTPTPIVVNANATLNLSIAYTPAN